MLLALDPRVQRGGVVAGQRPAPATCAMIGPPSRLASTKWTVTPLCLTPCAIACAGASTPGNAGNSDGCVLIDRAAGSARRTRGVSTRMKPGEHDRLDAVRASAASSAILERRRAIDAAVIDRPCAGLPAAVARASAGTPGRSRSRSRSCAGASSPRASASSSAWRFVPVPETSTPIVHRHVAATASPPARGTSRPTTRARAIREQLDGARRGVGGHDDQHAEAHVERAPHLVVADARARDQLARSRARPRSPDRARPRARRRAKIARWILDQAAAGDVRGRLPRRAALVEPANASA